jgi:hypothetical protein
MTNSRHDFRRVSWGVGLSGSALALGSAEWAIEFR